jgi:hypothetical protein
LDTSACLSFHKSQETNLATIHTRYVCQPCFICQLLHYHCVNASLLLYTSKYMSESKILPVNTQQQVCCAVICICSPYLHACFKNPLLPYLFYRQQDIYVALPLASHNVGQVENAYPHNHSTYVRTIVHPSIHPFIRPPSIHPGCPSCPSINASNPAPPRGVLRNINNNSTIHMCITNAPSLVRKQ